MAKPSNYVPKYVLKHVDEQIARLEKTQAERQRRIDSLREVRKKLSKMQTNDDNPVE